MLGDEKDDKGAQEKKDVKRRGGEKILQQDLRRLTNWSVTP